MLLPICNGTACLQNDTMHFVRFGSGKKTLIMLPGLGDGLTTVKGTAWPMALLYRAYTKDYTVYMFSRRNHLPLGYDTRDMARDLKEVMDLLGIDRADLVGVSMGGMIAQHFAADYPQRIGRLVLAVTCAAPPSPLSASICEWTELASRGDHAGLMESNVRRMYSEAYFLKNKWMIPIMGRLTKPASYERFFIQADACKAHNALDCLPRITCPALVIGGAQDQVLGADASPQIAATIPGSRLHMYPQWGHALYDEAKDFHRIVLDFLKES